MCLPSVQRRCWWLRERLWSMQMLSLCRPHRRKSLLLQPSLNPLLCEAPRYHPVPAGYLLSAHVEAASSAIGRLVLQFIACSEATAFWASLVLSN